ncbi:dynein regulatory complex subunit 5-like [Cephus cinctus]|uniref:Dynein regulatory complex subunit 5-like n=1 Tax=Cephus cinctus TaxID=211228 RepID=A0AAJ7RM74_CEPCN|nr:dynein regulatory complex subunit 5-like [Cephus cinctus]
MRILHTISKNTFEAYRCSLQTIQLPHEQNRSIRAEDEKWDEFVIPEIKVLALQVLVKGWKEYPILEGLPTCVDRYTLVEMLPTDLPFELVIVKIPYEHYWERAAKDRWTHNNPGEHGNSWRQLYCERHFADYLENLEPAFFEGQQEACNNLISLVRNYIQTLKIRRLVPSNTSSTGPDKDDEDKLPATELIVHHIPLNLILPKFHQLRELYINFGMIYMNDGFEWRDFEFSVEDCVKLSRCLSDSCALKKFSLTRSNLDQPRVAALLRGIAVNNRIEILDLSHCKLGDTGAHAVGEFLTKHRRLKELHLANNKIGESGVAGIVYGLLQQNSTPLKHLNLRLNPLRDAGGAHICGFLLRNKNIQVLNLSGCQFTGETGVGMAEIIASGYMKSFTLELDLSNNDLGPIAGEAFEVGMKTCSVILNLDVRMCNFTKESEYSISESIIRNREDKKREKLGASTARHSSVYVPLRAKSLQPPSEYKAVQERKEYD